MKKQLVILASIALLTLTTGCLGLGSNNSDDFGPENVSIEEIGDRSDLNNLSRFSSYTTNLSIVSSNSSESVTVFSTYEEVNKISERGYSDSSIFINQSKYTSDGVTYVRTESILNGTVEYKRATEPYNTSGIQPVTNDSTFETTNNISEQTGNISLQKQGYTTYNGRDVAVYSNISTDDIQPSFTNQNVTYDKQNITAYMSEDLSVPFYKIEYIGSTTDTNESVSLTTSVELRDINSTIVTEPSWISEFNSSD